MLKLFKSKPRIQTSSGTSYTDIEITSSLNFYMGRCHTIRPKLNLKRVGKSAGYALMLKHHLKRNEMKGRYHENPPGWHLYIHDKRENFTGKYISEISNSLHTRVCNTFSHLFMAGKEINLKASGRIEYVFAEINERVEVKLQSQYFSNVATKAQSCSGKPGYSDFKVQKSQHTKTLILKKILQCSESYIWQELSRKTNCSGPWIHETHVPPCSNYKSMMKLVGEYGKYIKYISYIY